MDIKYLLIAGFVVLIVISGCVSGGNTKDDSQNVPLITEEQAKDIRIETFNSCQNLLGKAVTFKGEVLYEECGKNCLGGCPNSGPSYCYYGLQDENNCLVYLESRIGEFPLTGAPEQIVNKFNFGEDVEVYGLIDLYTNKYCNINYEWYVAPE